VSRIGLRVVAPGLLFLGLTSWLVVRSLAEPIYNWDLVGYVAATLRLQGAEGEALLEQTWNAVDTGVRRPGVAERLATATPYSRAVSSDPLALEEQVPFYSPRVLYVGAMLGLATVGVPLVAATVVLSAVPVAALAVLMWWVVGRRHTFWAALLAVPLLGWWLKLPVLARASTADALALLFLVAGSWALVRNLDGRWRAMAPACFAAAVLSRHDAVLHVLVFTAILLVLPRIGGSAWRGVIGRATFVVAPSLVAYMVLAWTTGWYGWHVLVVHTFAGPLAYPADASLPPAWPIYLQRLDWTVAGLLDRPWASRELVAVALAAAAWPWASRRGRFTVGAALAVMAVRFVLFPVAGGDWLRFYLAPIVVIVLAVADTLPRLRLRKPNGPPAPAEPAS